MGGHWLSCSATSTTGSYRYKDMIQIAFRVAFLATVTLGAPAADADAEPFLHPLGYVAHAVIPCKIQPKTIVVGKACHAEPDCTTKSVVVGKKITGYEDPVCEDVEHVVPAVVPHVIGKREAEAEADADADPLLGYAIAHPVAVSTKITTKHCTPGAPILEDINQDVTTCVPKEVCTDIEGQVPETVCDEAKADEE